VEPDSRDGLLVLRVTQDADGMVTVYVDRNENVSERMLTMTSRMLDGLWITRQRTRRNVN
jgi:hypothetical protein